MNELQSEKQTFGILENEWQIAVIFGNGSFLVQRLSENSERESSEAFGAWLLSSVLFSSDGAPGVGEGQAAWQRRTLLMCSFPKKVLEPGVSTCPGPVSSQTIPEIHTDSPRGTVIGSASLESVGCVQALGGPVGLVTLCFQSSAS